MSDTKARWSVLLVAHAVAFGMVLTSLRLFLTPVALEPQLPPQAVRYLIYALSVTCVALAAGTVLALFVSGGSWWPALYLGSVPLLVVALPLVDPSAAHFVYAGVTDRLAGWAAAAASVLWVIGVALGVALALRRGVASES